MGESVDSICSHKFVGRPLVVVIILVCYGYCTKNVGYNYRWYYGVCQSHARGRYVLYPTLLLYLRLWREADMLGVAGLQHR